MCWGFVQVIDPYTWYGSPCTNTLSNYRDPQLQVGENYSYSLNLSPNICKSWYLNTHYIPKNCNLHCETNRLITTMVALSAKRDTLLANEMNRALGHHCAHIGWTGPGEPPEDGEMNEMTLPFTHRIRNSCPGGLRPSTLPLGHGGSPQYWLSHVDGAAETGNRTPNSRVKGSGANHYPRAPALNCWQGEPLVDGEMNEMALPFRHRIRHSSHGGLRPSTLLLGLGGSPQY